MAVTKTIEEMPRLAASRGGMCLSATYVRGSDHLEWQCVQGHRWSATPDSVKQGTWCPTCPRVRKLDTLETMHAAAARHDGRCLSQHYAGCSTPLEWECAQGHRWQATPASVKHRTWCPECARQQRKAYTLGDMHALAAARSGQCLSTAYTSGAQPLQWRCAQGHEWHATPVSIRRGAWCRQCYYDSMRGSLADMQALADSRGGRCLSTHYVDAHTPLRWQCAQGHTWEAVPHSVVDGRWCRQCASQNVHACTIEQMHELARSRGGKRLSAQYLGIVTLLAWQYACGHVWRSRPKTVLGGGWCPACFRRSRYAYSIQDMQELAHSRGGKYLSKEYLGAAVKLVWECQRGYEWATKPEYAMSLGEMPDFSLGDLTGALIVSFLTAIMIAAVMVGYLLFAGLATRKTVTCFYPERQPAAAPDNHGYLIRGNFITGVIAFWLSAFFGLATKPFDVWLPPHVAGVAQGTYWLALCSNVLLLLLDWRKRRRSFKYALFAVLAGSVAFLAVLGYASAMGYVTEPHVRPTPQTAAYFSPAAVGYWLSNTRARLLRNQLIATAAAVSLAFSIVTVGLIRVTRGHREANRSGRTPPPFFKNPDRKLLAAKACATVVFGFCSLVIFPFLDALASASPLRMQATTALTGGGYLILLNLAAFVVTGWKQRAGLGVAAFFLLFFVLQIPSGNMTLFPRMVVDTLGFGDRHATNIVLAGTECPVLAPYGADCSATKDANIGITNVNILNRLGSTVLIELQVRRTGVQPTGPLDDQRAKAIVGASDVSKPSVTFLTLAIPERNAREDEQRGKAKSFPCSPVLIAKLRSTDREKADGHVCWIQHTAQPDAPWARFGEFAAGWGRRLDEVLRPGEAGHALYPELECAAGDEYVRKTRFSAFIQGSSDLHERLAARGVDTVIVTGTVTNVCCESTARDAMMLDYKVHFVADANAARTDEEHNTTLANMLIWFADVRSTQELMTLIEAAPVSHVVSGRGA